MTKIPLFNFRNRLVFILLLSITMGCNKRDEQRDKDSVIKNNVLNFIVSGFDAISNYHPQGNDTLQVIYLDYIDAFYNGFSIPTMRQLAGGNFICRFSIQNTSGKPKKYYYKIYYQNESYKFNETDSAGKYNPFAAENFYGSWSDSSIQFRATPVIPADNSSHVIVDSIRITGNPRIEELYFRDGNNDRWKRNPRVGVYSFLLVVTEEEQITERTIPPWIQNICNRSDDQFINPYYFFLSGPGKTLPATTRQYSEKSLKVVARPDLGGGIYASDYFFPGVDFPEFVTPTCGRDVSLDKNAGFSQFIHYIDPSTRLENIPVVADVLKNNYSKRDYNWNRSFYRRDELIGGTPRTAKYPCETVYSDPVNKKIILKNPKTTPGAWRKENVGIITRHGFTYGKFRVKAKLTELLNKNNVWNGITNAIWMINQPGDGDWNLRRPCTKEGYMATYWGGRNDKRVERVGYSEIDFEILKTPAYCPDQIFPPVYQNPWNDPKNIESWNITMPEEILRDDGNITVACTNWDMACWQPENFSVGCKTVKYQDRSFSALRWDHWYRAITEKTPAADDLLFGSDYFYFEIEWKPTEIIWRIGPEVDKMYVVGYMNDKLTSIPNNQMLLIITQEFHNTQWWPGSPYQQKFIPFPLNDIIGEVYDVTIE